VTLHFAVSVDIRGSFVVTVSEDAIVLDLAFWLSGGPQSLDFPSAMVSAGKAPGETE
jgi:hypothetical protein